MARISTSTAKDGDTLNIGKCTPTFVQTPMVHWLDNMVTYSDYDKILFSNDAFGQHYASSTRFEDASDYCEVMKQARKYYANIVLPYGRQTELEAAEFTMPLPIHVIGWIPSDEDLDAVCAQAKDLVKVGKQL
ncbi:MAG: hypothetical protein ACFNLS_04830 [Lancefieldella sp.]